jgi:hypothetical protein
MMGVLDNGDAKACLKKMRDDPRQQRGLAGAAPSREANHFHLILRERASLHHCEKQSDEAIQALASFLDCFASLAMTRLAAFRSFSEPPAEPGLCFVKTCFISAIGRCHANLLI